MAASQAKYLHKLMTQCRTGQGTNEEAYEAIGAMVEKYKGLILKVLEKYRPDATQENMCIGHGVFTMLVHMMMQLEVEHKAITNGTFLVGDLNFKAVDLDQAQLKIVDDLLDYAKEEIRVQTRGQSGGAPVSKKYGGEMNQVFRAYEVARALKEKSTAKKSWREVWPNHVFDARRKLQNIKTMHLLSPIIRANKRVLEKEEKEYKKQKAGIKPDEMPDDEYAAWSKDFFHDWYKDDEEEECMYSPRSIRVALAAAAQSIGKTYDELAAAGVKQREGNGEEYRFRLATLARKYEGYVFLVACRGSKWDDVQDLLQGLRYSTSIVKKTVKQETIAKIKTNPVHQDLLDLLWATDDKRDIHDPPLYGGSKYWFTNLLSLAGGRTPTTVEVTGLKPAMTYCANLYVAEQKSGFDFSNAKKNLDEKKYSQAVNALMRCMQGGNSVVVLGTDQNFWQALLKGKITASQKSYLGGLGFDYSRSFMPSLDYLLDKGPTVGNIKATVPDQLKASTVQVCVTMKDIPDSYFKWVSF